MKTVKSLLTETIAVLIIPVISALPLLWMDFNSIPNYKDTADNPAAGLAIIFVFSILIIPLGYGLFMWLLNFILWVSRKYSFTKDFPKLLKMIFWPIYPLVFGFVFLIVIFLTVNQNADSYSFFGDLVFGLFPVILAVSGIWSFVMNLIIFAKK